MIRAIAMRSAAIFALLVSCNTLQTAGGGGTETINTFAMLSNGKPASEAVVRVLDSRAWAAASLQGGSAIVDSAITNSAGRCTIVLPADGRLFNIQVDAADEGAFIAMKTSAFYDGDTIRLASFASYGGLLNDPSQGINLAMLAGSAYKVPVDASGRFVFDKVAPGAYTVAGKNGDRMTVCGSVTLASGDMKRDSSLNASPEILLVDNFESGVGPNTLGRLLPGVYWYLYSDGVNCIWDTEIGQWKWSSNGGGTTVTIDSISDGNGGTAMSFAALLDTVIAWPWAGAGFSWFGYKASGVDFTGLRQFSLRARGRGVVWVRFETAALSAVDSGFNNYTYPIVLDSAWREYTVPVDSLRILPVFSQSDLYPWSAVASQVVNIEFDFPCSENSRTDTLRMSLDDFRIYGVTLSDIVR